MYQYFGILSDAPPADEVGGVIRVWTGPDGEQLEETFRTSLTWTPSHRFSPMARPDDKRVVELDEPAVQQFIERMTVMYGKAR